MCIPFDVDTCSPHLFDYFVVVGSGLVSDTVPVVTTGPGDILFEPTVYVRWAAVKMQLHMLMKPQLGGINASSRSHVLLHTDC